MSSDGSGMTGVATVELIGPDGEVKSRQIVDDEGETPSED